MKNYKRIANIILLSYCITSLLSCQNNPDTTIWRLWYDQPAEKWEEALTIWQSIYEAQTNKKSKAEAAANIAVGYEMVGKFNEALDWAKKSLALFKEQTSDEKDSNVALLTLYEQVITSRIQANNKLNMQFGKE